MRNSPEKKSSGCGLLNAFFRRRSKWHRRSNSTGSLKTHSAHNDNNDRNSMQRIPTNWDALNNTQKQPDRIIARPGPNHSKPAAPHNHQNQDKKSSTERRKVPEGTTGISGELDSMIFDHQRSKAASNLVRASSGNVMLYGDLGNLRQPGSNNIVVTLAPVEEQQNGKYGHEEAPPSLISTTMDPEELKVLGNEDYKNGRFAEALALYDAAIAIHPNKASYRSNKSAALTALGRLLEAAFECREAIRLQPQYQRAHNRLATLYLRLGQAETALHHYKQAGHEADPDVLNNAKNLQLHLSNCTEAKKQRDWNTLLKESSLAISAAGADSAPQIFALKAEALIRLHRYHDADETLQKGPKFDVDECTKFFGPAGNATMLIIQAQVDMAAGRVDEAWKAAEQAARLDTNNKEASMVAKKMCAVASARSNGNELFKAGRFSEACIAYGEGLEHDPYNAVLLSNRSACRTKLEQYDQALEDCNAALTFRPSFIKARLRKCDCLLKMGKLKACIQECESLMKECPENEEVYSILDEVKIQLSKRVADNEDENQDVWDSQLLKLNQRARL
ncbi:PREDICTED: inactive TPR repeat-containing thioredoxin TTL3-like [Ipomoea nil]|uniref:inactive TPR repeat-containing thioredoxin TTL3-like n=1 Tax=Ipomoea nil TaxID=35883 RepID=UPI000900A8E9|nr:PREDICTED: inactive TPR repeat-containing thioredoxin TTL3-like [Ipomoea nil]